MKVIATLYIMCVIHGSSKRPCTRHLFCYNKIIYYVQILLMSMYVMRNTVELPNNGHIGSGPFVLYIEVVPL